MSELVEIALISMFGMWVSLLIMFGTWLLRQHFKHRYLLKRAKWNVSHKTSKVPTKEAPTTTANLASILQSLQGVDLDKLGDLMERLPIGGELGGESGEIGELMPLLRPLIEGFAKKKEETPEQPQGY